MKGFAKAALSALALATAVAAVTPADAARIVTREVITTDRPMVVVRHHEWVRHAWMRREMMRHAFLRHERHEMERQAFLVRR